MNRSASCGDSPEANGNGAPWAVGPNARALQGRLGLDGAVMPRRTGLYLPAALSYEAWEHVGKQICLVSDSSAWWLGDWLVYGQDRYGDRYRLAVEATSLDYQTLRNYAWVARQIPVSRRRDSLSFQHHAEVAALDEEEQEIWLDRAVMFEWSRNELRRQLREARNALRGEESDPVVLRVAVDPDRERRWHEAADRMACSLDEWIALVLDQAAYMVLDPADVPATAERPALQGLPLTSTRL
jgi:hypothetical protein